MTRDKIIAKYEITEHLVLKVCEDRHASADDKRYYVQARGGMAARYFQTLNEASEYCAMRLKEVEYLNSIERGL